MAVPNNTDKRKWTQLVESIENQSPEIDFFLKHWQSCNTNWQVAIFQTVTEPESTNGVSAKDNHWHALEA